MRWLRPCVRQISRAFDGNLSMVTTVDAAMTYFFIGLAILLIIGPIFALLPSKRQKAQLALRKVARERGLSVELTQVDDPDPQPGAYISATGKRLPQVKACIAYRVQRKRQDTWQKLPRVNWAIARRSETSYDLAEGWSWIDTDTDTLSPQFVETLKNLLRLLPADTFKVDEVGSVASIYWTEQGDEGDVAAIHEFLARVVAVDHRKEGELDQADETPRPED